VIWMDAHSDINTPETSPSGNVHGMPLAALLGLGSGSELEMLSGIFGYSPKIAAENTVLIGVRDIDSAERENILRAGVAAVYTMREIDERGMRAVMEEALRVAGNGTAGITFRWIWTGSIRRMRRGWGRRCGAGRRTARLIWRWRSWRITGGC